MKRLELGEYRRLTSGAQVLSSDEYGDKVLLTPDGRIIKLFRRKRLISSTLLWPYALRFAGATKKLSALGFRTVHVEAVHRIPTIRRDAVVYPMIEGRPLREALAEGGDAATLLPRLAALLADLHAKGVYFRAVHFGNVLVQRDGGLALIDVSEARFRRRPLNPTMRARNFRPLRSYDVDAAAIDRFGAGAFVDCYLQQAKLSPSQAAEFRRRLVHVDPQWGPGA